jgi:hypothetical protein
MSKKDQDRDWVAVPGMEVVSVMGKWEVHL